MIKIITLANLQLFLTKCKTLFASKKHTHTAADITGLPSGGGADSTRYTVDEHGYTVIKDKYGNDAFWANGVNRELRDSKGNTAVRIKNPEGLLPNNLGGGVEINYGKNANGTVEKAIVTSDTNVQVKTPDGNTVARIEDGKTSWKTPTSTTDAIQLTPTKSQLKFNNKGLEVKESKATLTHAKEVLLNSEAGSGASLRLSENDVHLDGIDGGMMVMCRLNGTNGISYSLNFPQKKNMSDTNDTNNDIESPAVKTFLSSIFGKTVSILGDTLIPNGTVFLQNNQIKGLGISIATDVSSEIGIAGHIFFGSMPTIGYPFETPLSVFTTPRMPSFSSLQSFIDETSGKLNVITIPDDEVSNIDSFTSLIVDDTKWSIFTNESGTQSWIAESKEKIYPLTYPVWETYTDFLSDGFAFISVNDNAEIRLFLCLSDNPENIGLPSLDTIGIGVERTLDVEKAIHLLLRLAESNGITI